MDIRDTFYWLKKPKENILSGENTALCLYPDIITIHLMLKSFEKHLQEEPFYRNYIKKVLYLTLTVPGLGQIFTLNFKWL